LFKFLKFLFLFFYYFFKLPRVKSLMWHVALSMTRGKVSLRVKVLGKCHCLHFNLVPTCVYLFQFSIHICLFVWILFKYFFFKWRNIVYLL